MAMTDSMLLMCSSLPMVESAGAMMVETMMRLKPVADRTLVTAHFLVAGQFWGFSRSMGVANLTKKGSSDTTGEVCFSSSSAGCLSLSKCCFSMSTGCSILDVGWFQRRKEIDKRNIVWCE